MLIVNFPPDASTLISHGGDRQPTPAFRSFFHRGETWRLGGDQKSTCGQRNLNANSWLVFFCNPSFSILVETFDFLWKISSKNHCEKKLVHPPLKFNMEPENDGLESMIFLFKWLYSQVPAVHLPGCSWRMLDNKTWLKTFFIGRYHKNPCENKNW